MVTDMSYQSTLRNDLYTAALVMSAFILLIGLAFVTISATVPNLSSMLTSGIVEATIGALGIALVIWFGGRPVLARAEPAEVDR